MAKRDIKDLSIEALQAQVESLGLRSYVVDQLLFWLYRKSVATFAEMTNLSGQTQSLLNRELCISRFNPVKTLASADGSRKFLLKLFDGKKIESILMPQGRRLTLCVSSQVGCAMGCRFCRTATMGLVRHLTQGEILEQVLAVQRELEPSQRITNLVFMGMGEPFHNYSTLISVLQILRDPRAFHFGKNKITVSTSGLAPAIEKFGEDSDVKLALSLNAADDAFRRKIMPIVKSYPMERLKKACRIYNDKTGQAITMEYVLFANLNDRPEDVKRLCHLLSGLKIKINLIPYNEYPGSSYRRPSKESVRAFQQALAAKHFQVNIRYSKGLDILGACGQMATEKIPSDHQQTQ